MTETLWRACCEKNGIPPETPYEAWTFGGNAADELAELVLAGIKTATASSLLAYETTGDPLPQAGEYSVILRADGQAVIRTLRVSLVPFDAVSAEHAYLEGEGSRTLEAWREIHRRFFAPGYQAAGKPFDEKGVCVLEEFVRVYP